MRRLSDIEKSVLHAALVRHNNHLAALVADAAGDGNMAAAHQHINIYDTSASLLLKAHNNEVWVEDTP